jgi:hypothetical protein
VFLVLSWGILVVTGQQWKNCWLLPFPEVDGKVEIVLNFGLNLV